MRVAKTAVAGLLLLSALAACGEAAAGTRPATGVSGGPSAGPAAGPSGGPFDSPSDSPSAGSSTGSRTGSAGKGSNGKRPAGQPSSGKSSGTTPAACRTGDLDVDITAQPSRAKATRTGLVAVTNTTSRTCTLRGWLSVTLVNAANEPVAVPTRKVEQPGAATDIKLKPGTSAFAGIKWTLCDKADTACGVGNTIRVGLSGSAKGSAATLDGFPAAEKSAITMKSLSIGTLQPVTQGVVAW